ncbi:Carcinoembryonic Antigen-Related Cell Adhesion Molecule 4 [Manis pentadactyla]|nr:Carcinoembryonic Antigen-Related Cell Adhesion Molecule 4 [Manis pentadactyla]
MVGGDKMPLLSAFKKMASRCWKKGEEKSFGGWKSSYLKKCLAHINVALYNQHISYYPRKTLRSVEGEDEDSGEDWIYCLKESKRCHDSVQVDGSEDNLYQCEISSQRNQKWKQ